MDRGARQRAARRGLRLLLLLVLGVLPGGGLRAAEPGPGAFPRDLVQAIFATAFEVVLDRHLDSAEPAEIGLWSLRGLEVVEPALRPELRAGTLLLSGPERLIAARPMPPAAPPGAPRTAAAGPLAVGVAALFDAAWRASPRLRRAGPERMLQSAFEELFNHLDPYSRYLAPEEAVAARARRIGQSGLGLRIAAGRGNAVVVAAVVPGGPAEAAGLRVGDRVLAVDGIPVSAAALGTAAALLEGPAETEVALRIQRGGRRMELLLPRSLPPPDAIRAERAEDILWLRLDGFSNDTDRKLADVVAAALAAGPVRGIVLDLRGNRGGLLAQAVAVASAFLQTGVVAQTAGRHPDAARLYLASGGDLAEGLPLVVLVDGRTASAAEIVAAALSDRGRAVAVGSATMGKGLVQVVVPLANGGELLVTWSRVLSPLGWPIQGLGVLPAVCTSLGAEATADTLRRLRQGEPSPMAPVLARLRAARAPVPTSEVAALRGACPPAEGRDTDLLAARALIEAPRAYAEAGGR